MSCALIAVYAGSSTRAVVSTVFGISAVKKTTVYLPKLAIDVILSHSQDLCVMQSQISRRVSRTGWYASLRVYVCMYVCVSANHPYSQPEG